MNKLNLLSENLIQKPLVRINENDVDEVISAIRRNKTRWEPVKRPARLGDQVSLRYKVTYRGKLLEQHQTEPRRTILGDGELPSTLERTHLVSAKAGDRITASVKISKTQTENKFAGKMLVYEIDVEEVCRPRLPALNRAFIRELGVAKGGMAALRREVRNIMQREVDSTVKRLVREQVMDLLLEHYPLTVEKSEIEREVARRSRDYEKRQGISGTPNRSRSSLAGDIHDFATLQAILQDIVRTHAIPLDTERLNTSLNALAMRSDNSGEQIKNLYDDYATRTRVEAGVLEDQAIEHVLSHTALKERPTNYKSFVAKNKSDKGASERPVWPIIELRSDNKCSFCGTSKCCTYITQKIPAPRSKADFDMLLWQVSHENIEVFKDSDGWRLLIDARCNHLQSDGRCGIYEIRPQICRDYSNRTCEFDGDAKESYELHFSDYESLLTHCKKRFRRWEE